MLSDLDELRTFHRILSLGSLSAAGRDLGIGVAVVSKRLASLERRTGTRLVARTTRRLAATEAGAALLGRIDRILDEIAQAEAQLAGDREAPQGLLRVSAPVSFGRNHVVPCLAGLVRTHPGLSVDLQLTDTVADMVGSGIDAVVRIGGLDDSSAVMRKLADNRRILVASPAFLDLHGRPRTPEQAALLPVIRYGPSTDPWRLVGRDGATAELRPRTRLRTDSGDAARDWALNGLAMLLKSEIDVAADLRCGTLERVLDGWASAAAPVYALFPSGQHLPPKIRVFVEAMVERLASV